MARRATSTRRALGDYGERAVTKLPCPRCKRQGTLRRLPGGFKCADTICDFCGYLAQVKTTEKVNIASLPKRVLGAAWQPQSDRMDAGIFFPLFIVIATPPPGRQHAVYFLPADLQERRMFEPRRPLSATAKRPGWQGFVIRLDLPGLHMPVRVV